LTARSAPLAQRRKRSRPEELLDEGQRLQGASDPAPSGDKVCVKNTKLSVPKAAKTLEEIRTILQTNYPLLAPLTP
jgi:hypothetical protein